MNIKIYNKNGDLVCITEGFREAAKFVASRENIQDVYIIENLMLNSLQLNRPVLDKYKIKLEE